MNAIYTKDYKNDKIVPILKEYSAKKYWRKREFVDAEIWARLGWTIQDDEESASTTDTNNNNAQNNTTQVSTEQGQ